MEAKEKNSPMEKYHTNKNDKKKKEEKARSSRCICLKETANEKSINRKTNA